MVKPTYEELLEALFTQRKITFALLNHFDDDFDVYTYVEKEGF